MSDRDYLYDHVCAHGSMARFCRVCDLEDEARRLRAKLEEAQLRSIEARNPGSYDDGVYRYEIGDGR